MKKALAIIGGIVAAASIFTVIVVILKKIKLSFTIESAGDDFDIDEQYSNGDISVSIENDDTEADEIAQSFDEQSDEEETFPF